MLGAISQYSCLVANMHFQDKDLHDAMKISLDTLINIINNSNDTVIKGNAAISLANILFDIYDRQKEEELNILAEDYIDDEDDETCF